MRIVSIVLCALLVTACGHLARLNPFPANDDTVETAEPAQVAASTPADAPAQVDVNRYLWAASLDVLSFLPIQTVDPFTGVIVTGYGTPPGGTRAYRATVQVRSASLTAQSLSLSLNSRSGPVSLETQTAVEDAILTRARQLRLADQ